MTNRPYEALVILKASGTDEEMARHAAGVEALVTKLGGAVERSQPMGRRRLAFPIGRQSEGYYYLVRFTAPTQQIGELERLLRLNEVIVRFLVLQRDEQPAVPAKAAAPVRS